MEEKLLNDLKPLFIYTKKVGECAITAEMELNRVTNISKHISKIDKEGKTIPAIPMIGMFKGPIKKILEMYGEEMIRHLDDNNDEDDYHSPLVTIYPDQKKINIRDFAYFVIEEEYDGVFRNSERLMEDMIEDNVKNFRFDFWGGWGDRELDIQALRGDRNAVPGLVRPYYRFFTDLLEEKFTGWDTEEGSYGTIEVNESRIIVSCYMRSKEWRWTGFEKTLSVNS
jgi:hypothetical protein